MRYFKRDLLGLITGLLIFSSCQKSDLVGLDVDNQIQSDTVLRYVNAITVKEDDLVTSGLAQHPFGYLNDPIFGSTQASLALGLTLPSDNFSFGTNAQLDSVVLVLKYGNQFYGDSSDVSRFPIKVYQLNERYNSSSSYLNTKVWNHGQDPINKALQVGSFPWRDSVRIMQILDGIPDTAKTLAPQLRVQLTEAFANSNLINASAGTLANNTAFSNAFKGLFITSEVAQSDIGGITFFDLQTAGVSGLEVYYRNTKSDNTPDTNKVVFGLTNFTASSSIIHKYDDTEIQSQLNIPGAEKVYVQPLGGLRAKLDFENLKDNPELVGNNGKIAAINKAELIITEVSAPGTGSILSPSPRLTLYRTDIAGIRKPVPDNAIGIDARYLPEAIFGGFYNKDTRQYKFIITSYIQDILSGRIKNFETYLAPMTSALTGAANTSAVATTAKRAVLGNKGNANPEHRIKLNIFYTKAD